jgi:hypothetical protein
VLYFRAIVVALCGLYFVPAAFLESWRHVSNGNNSLNLSMPGTRHDFRAPLRDAEEQIKRNPERLRNLRIANLAKTSLRSEPLSLASLRLLITDAEASERRDRARVYALLTSRISRREPLSQIWLINEASRHSDLKGAIKHYDLVLRTNPSAGDLLLPILSAALSDDAVRSELASTLSSKPAWIFVFLHHYMSTRDDMRPLAALLSQIGPLPNGAEFDSLSRTFRSRAFETGAYSELLAYQKAVFPEIAARQANIVGFTPATTDPQYAPPGWELLSNAEFQTQIADNGSAIKIVGLSGARGDALRRTTALAPGRYRFVEERKVTEGSWGRWSLFCVATSHAQMIWISDAIGPGRRPNDIVIPQGCYPQILKFEIASGVTQQGFEQQVKLVDVKPLKLGDPKS